MQNSNLNDQIAALQKAREGGVDLDLSYDNLVDLLIGRSHELGEKSAYIYKDTLKNIKKISYQELTNRAMDVAHTLSNKNLSKKNVLLIYDCDLEYIVGFFGCLFAGAVAVPVYVPTNVKHLPRMQKIINDCQADYCLTTSTIHKMLSFYISDDLKIEFITTNNIESNPGQKYQKPDIKSSDIAFLQYTSGSTGEPKGVILTHANLMANLKMIRTSFQLNEADEIQVSWLPFYHDMGLIGVILSTILNRRTSVLLHPMTIVKPLLWLQTITEYKATGTVAPNFAFDLCLQRITDADLAQLDLSHLKSFLSGAEPVQAKTLENFFDRFSKAGLKKSCLTPCYGLAEATLAVTAKPFNTEFKKIYVSQKSLSNKTVELVSTLGAEIKEFVSCGRAAGNQNVMIFDTEKKTAKGIYEIGEILASGEHIAQGYWQKDDLTQDTFISFESQRWLRTGDLGFLDENHELFVVGRIKDLIIIRGKNFSPQDIENTARKTHPTIEYKVNAAFSTSVGGNEQVILVQEVPPGTSDQVLLKIRTLSQQAIQSELGINLDHIIFVKAHSIPRTSSGKVRRNETRIQFENKRLKIYTDSLMNQMPVQKLIKNVNGLGKNVFMFYVQTKERFAAKIK